MDSESYTKKKLIYCMCFFANCHVIMSLIKLHGSRLTQMDNSAAYVSWPTALLNIPYQCQSNSFQAPYGEIFKSESTVVKSNNMENCRHFA